MIKYTKIAIFSVLIMSFFIVTSVFANVLINGDDIVINTTTDTSVGTNLISNGSDDNGSSSVATGETSDQKISRNSNPITNGDDDFVIGNTNAGATSTGINTGNINNGSDDNGSGLTTNGTDDVGGENTNAGATSTNNNNGAITNGDDDTANPTTTPIVIPVTPVITPSNSSGSSSGGRSPLLLTPDSCNYITSYLKFGANNDSAQVTRLQTFLKNIENMNVDVNGIFDLKTFDAVKVFQTKYANEIMFPWGDQDSTGYVYYTTQKKINELYCKKTFNLTPEQALEINSYKNAKINIQEALSSLENSNIEVSSTTIQSTTTNSTSSQEVGSNTNESQVAAVGNTGFLRKIWNFFKWLLGL